MYASFDDNSRRRMNDVFFNAIYVDNHSIDLDLKEAFSELRVADVKRAALRAGRQAKRPKPKLRASAETPLLSDTFDVTGWSKAVSV